MAKRKDNLVTRFDPIPLHLLLEAKTKPEGCSPARWRMVQRMKRNSRLGVIGEAVKTTSFAWR